MFYVLAYNEANPSVALSEAEIAINSTVLIIDSSDLVATVLAGAISHLLSIDRRIKRMSHYVRD